MVDGHTVIWERAEVYLSGRFVSDRAGWLVALTLGHDCLEVFSPRGELTLILSSHQVGNDVTLLVKGHRGVVVLCLKLHVLLLHGSTSNAGQVTQN